MITVNRQEYTFSHFPNGEIKFPEIPAPASLMDYAQIITSGDVIEWIFEKNEEFFVIQMLVKFLQNRGHKISLHVPFCPYGQQDRKIPGQLFSFKYFAQILNDMNLNEVVFLDPHSLVMDAAVRNSSVRYLDISEQMEEYDMLFYPDNGAAKKYSEIYSGRPYRFGNKKRNLDTGEILKYEVIADRGDIEGKKVLIVDDLCMGGRTFKEAAKALKELGAAKIGLQITHLMPESQTFIQELKSFGIEELFTTFKGISSRTVRMVYPDGIPGYIKNVAIGG